MTALKGLECLKQGLLSMPHGENRRRSDRVMRQQIQEQAETQVGRPAK